ncbi:hypothetical protein GGI15_001308 [Coemansia interrupta]|uniref:Origin recognition complex subunit 5 n=1 Tax=Coemansia interrupta TaxID=1126814 RepID=A0A9W8HJS4_9FUNG|nr:hypothetical protein GGI15_001308 [Coemansia interrupta]
MSTADVSTQLSEKFPGRGEQVDQLLSLLGEPTDASPGCIFVYGPSASGKTSVLQSLFSHYQAGKTRVAFVSGVECFTARLLFERTLNAWAGHVPSKDNAYSNYRKCDSLVDFVARASELLGGGEEETHYLVVDQAERLRGTSVLTSLVRLSELLGSQANVSVILVSAVVWDKFRVRHGGATDPTLVFFPRYTKAQTLDILAHDCPPGEPSGFFLTFVDALYEVFHRNSTSVQELRHLVAMLYPKFVQPVFEGQATRSEFSRLFKLCQPYFSAASERLYLREISTSEWQRVAPASAKNRAEDVAQAIYELADGSGSGIMDLPYYTKFLLVAGYLASYNPSRLDMQYFARGKDPSAKGRKRKRQADDALGGQKRQQLLGPKAFAIERLLAIFYSIVAEAMDSSVDVQVQIASLVTLRLFTRTSNGDRLDGVKCKCNVGLETIRAISRSVQFEVDRFLYDFA